MATFPAIRPGSRPFTRGDWASVTHRALDGGEVVVVNESVERGAKVTLTFPNVNNTTWQSILDFYRQTLGTFEGFYFSTITMQASRTKIGYWWRFVDQPQATDHHDNIRTVTVTVKQVPRVIQQAGGLTFTASSRLIVPSRNAGAAPVFVATSAIYPPFGATPAGPTFIATSALYPPAISGPTFRATSEIFPGSAYDPRTILCVQFDGANNSEDFVNSAVNGPSLSITSGNSRPYITTSGAKFGQAGRFTPVATSYALLETALNDGFSPGSDDFFIGVWVKNTGSWSGGFAFSIGSSSSSNGQYLQVLTNRIGFAFFGLTEYTSSVTDQFLNQTVNCVVDRNAGSVRFFISTNGTSFTQVGSTATVSTYSINSPDRFATIGGSRRGGSDSFSGLLDSVMVARRSYWDGSTLQAPLASPYVP